MGGWLCLRPPPLMRIIQSCSKQPPSPLFEPVVFSDQNVNISVFNTVTFVFQVQMNCWVLSWGAGFSVFVKLLFSLSYIQICTLFTALNCIYYVVYSVCVSLGWSGFCLSVLLGLKLHVWVSLDVFVFFLLFLFPCRKALSGSDHSPFVFQRVVTVKE